MMVRMVNGGLRKEGSQINPLQPAQPGHAKELLLLSRYERGDLPRKAQACSISSPHKTTCEAVRSLGELPPNKK